MPHRSSPLFVNLEQALEPALMHSFQMTGYDPRSIRLDREFTSHVTGQCSNIVIMDTDLNYAESLRTCRLLSQQDGPEVILLSHVASEAARIAGFDAGAADVIVAPFYPREILLRARRILASTMVTKAANGAPRVDFNDARTGITLNGTFLKLTRREHKILKTLADRPGRVLSRNQIIEIAFASELDVYDRMVDTHVKNIRKKAKDVDGKARLITSVYGEGYIYEEG